MTEQIKMGVKMLRYGHNIGLNMGMAGFFFLFGVVIECLPIFQLRIWGDYMIIVNGMWMVQILYSVNVAGLVQTSPWKKRLQTSVPVFIGYLGYALCYLVIVLLKILEFVRADAGQLATVPTMLIIDAVIGAWMLVYCGTVFKYYIPSTIIFIGVFYGWFFGSDILQGLPQTALPIWAAVVIGYVILLAGAALQYGLARLVYRKALDKRGQLRGLQKYM